MKMNKLYKTLAVSAAVVGMAVAAVASVTVKGSDTLLVLNQRWAEAFSKSSSVSVNVTGGGSSIGIKSFIAGTCDLAAASRKMKKSEVDQARNRGGVAYEIPVALDGLAIIVHESNPVKSLSMDQLRKIYIGQVTNWKDVGGKNEPIVTFSRNSNSGTYGFYQENVLKNQNWGPGVRFMGSTSEEASEVAKATGGIAYGGVAYFKNKKSIKILPISKAAGSEPLYPSEVNVRNRSYPIWRYLYYYSNGAPKGDVKKYVDFCLSAQGQKIVEQVGYYSLKG